MKKLFVIAAALLIGLQANAQLIFNGGYLHQTESTTITEKNAQNEDVTINGTDLLDGFYAGAKYRINLEGITPGLSLAPGANVSFLFGRHKALDEKDIMDNKARMNQIALNIPIHVQYLFEFNSDFKLEAWAGPTFQLGLFDRVADSEDNPTILFDRYKTVNLTGTFGEVLGPILRANYRSQEAINRFNFFLGAGVGFEIAELIHINVGYDFGLLNLSTANNCKITRGLLRVGVGYNF